MSRRINPYRSGEGLETVATPYFNQRRWRRPEAFGRHPTNESSPDASDPGATWWSHRWPPWNACSFITSGSHVAESPTVKVTETCAPLTINGNRFNGSPFVVSGNQWMSTPWGSWVNGEFTFTVANVVVHVLTEDLVLMTSTEEDEDVAQGIDGVFDNSGWTFTTGFFPSDGHSGSDTCGLYDWATLLEFNLADSSDPTHEYSLSTDFQITPI